MRFSIIVQVHNCAAQLSECVGSLLEQSCRDMEIILVDDGSCDDSPMLCDGYASAFPETVRVIHRETGNKNGARNTGLEAARGEYLLFVDNADRLDHAALACLSRCMDETEADAYLFGSMELQGGRLTPGYRPAKQNKGAFSPERYPQWLPVRPAVTTGAWKKALFDNSGIRFGKSTWYGDFEIAVRLLGQCRSAAVLPERLYIHRQTRQDAIQSPRRNQELLETLDSLHRYFTRRGMTESTRRYLTCLAVEQVLLCAGRILENRGEQDTLRSFAGYLDTHFPGYETENLLGEERQKAAELLKKGHFLRLKLALARIRD